MNAPTPVDLQMFEQHVSRPDFKLALRERRWEIRSISWPKVVMRIFVKVKNAGPTHYDLRFDCSGYPNQAPTAMMWDGDTDQSLPFARWPTGRSVVPPIFNPGWQAGAALYLPCDRAAIQGHDDWVSKHPNWIWQPTVGIFHYLRIVHALLNSEDYTGIRGA